MRFVAGVGSELVENGLVFECNGGCEIKPVSEKSELSLGLCESEKKFREGMV